MGNHLAVSSSSKKIRCHRSLSRLQGNVRPPIDNAVHMSYTNVELSSHRPGVFLSSRSD